jgi:transposase-like protein
MDFYRQSKNVALTCRHFGISRQTFYRWLKRYEPLDLTSLEERSHCLGDAASRLGLFP